MTSNSSSLLASQFHIASAVRAGFVSNLRSKQAIFVVCQDKIDNLVIVAISYQPVVSSLKIQFSQSFEDILAFEDKLQNTFFSPSF